MLQSNLMDVVGACRVDWSDEAEPVPLLEPSVRYEHLDGQLSELSTGLSCGR